MQLTEDIAEDAQDEPTMSIQGVQITVHGKPSPL